MMLLFFLQQKQLLILPMKYNLGIQLRRRHFLTLLQRKWNTENSGKCGKCAALILKLRFFLPEESSTSRMSSVIPSSQDWSLKISESLLNFYELHIIKRKYFVCLHTLFWHIWYHNLLNMPEQEWQSWWDNTKCWQGSLEIWYILIVNNKY